MDLFEKIDLFEKMATELVEGQHDDGSETLDTIDQLDPNPEVKASVSARIALLKSALKK